MSDVMDAEAKRFPDVEGGRNFRDLGGYATDDGRRVKWGKLYRSGSLAGMTEAGQATLRALGVRTLIDLRATGEREMQPVDWFPGEGRTYWSRDYLVGFGDLRILLEKGIAREEDAREAMMIGYREIAFSQAPGYREMFARLKAGDVPLVVNCSAGKDRAGTGAALMLLALGVPRETIVEDYLITNKVYGDGANRRAISSSQLMAQQPPGVIDAILGCQADYLEAAFASIDTRGGGLDAYLESELGVTPDERQALRDSFTE